MADQTAALMERVSDVRNDFREMVARMTVAEELSRVAMFMVAGGLGPKDHARMIAWLRETAFTRPAGSEEFIALVNGMWGDAVDRIASDYAETRRGTRDDAGPPARASRKTAGATK